MNDLERFEQREVVILSVTFLPVGLTPNALQ